VTSGSSDRPRATRVAALLVVLGAAAIRFAPFLLGGTLYRRDAGFFFGPWRLVLARFLRAGEAPLWNDWMSAGRPFAADPNAAVFWPLSALLFVLSPTALSMVNVFLVLVAFFFALRAIELSPWAAAAGGIVLLFSGVFQALPVYATTCAAALPLAFALSQAPRLASGDAAVRRRAVGLAAIAFGLSAFGGEPAVTLMGGAAFVALALGAGRGARARTGGVALVALGLGAGLAAIQVLPAAFEVARSARSVDLKPEHGALFFSVRPARVLTLLEPRLTGDASGEAGSYWGAGTFDSGSPYFDDLALGLVPLLFAAAAWRDPRGRACLLLAGGAAVLSFGRFLPGYTFAARAFPFVRYPEKWWLLVTFALAAAAAVGVDRVFSGDAESRERARGILLRMAVGMALFCGALLSLALGAADLLRKGIWAAGLGAGSTAGAVVASVLRPLLLLGTLSLALIAALVWLVARNRLSAPLFAAILSFLFLADAARRVAGTCPAGPAELYTRDTAAVALVKSVIGSGRFYDDGADDPPTAARRARDAGGLDELRPETGVALGLRYAGENDIDRMTAAASLAFARETAALPWGAEKLARLRLLGVTVLRTAAPPPDPQGSAEVGRFGADRVVRVEGAPAEFALVPSGAGSVAILERRASSARLRVHVALPAAVLAISRTYDPNGRLSLDGKDVEVRATAGFLSAADVPKGDHDVVLRYENHAFRAGAALSLAFLAAGVLGRLPRRRS
jgi:hypothetical protein